MRKLSASDREVRLVALVTAGYVMVAGMFAFATGNREFVFYIVVMLVLMVSVYAVHRRIGLGATLLWCLSGWGLMHMAGGLLRVPAGWPTHESGPVLYNLWLVPGVLKYDQLVHAYGFGITTWLCWQALRAGMVASAPELRPQPTIGLMVLCAAGGMGFGAFNEVVEFVATLTIPNTNVGGYVNTGWDLVANLVGCCVAATLIGWRSRRGK